MKRKPPTPLEALQSRWHAKTGDPMPESVACLPINEIHKRLAVVQSKEQAAAARRQVYGESMMAFDGRGFY